MSEYEICVAKYIQKFQSIISKIGHSSTIIIQNSVFVNRASLSAKNTEKIGKLCDFSLINHIFEVKCQKMKYRCVIFLLTKVLINDIIPFVIP